MKKLFVAEFIKKRGFYNFFEKFIHYDRMGSPAGKGAVRQNANARGYLLT